ncbi:MAG: ribonuclease Z [Clostridia bacterium]|nr:ribonuclease Z [Clostridia bacterium]
MKVIVCVDNSFGMTFNYRRLSRDRNVIADIMSLLDGDTLYMNNYSYRLFEKTGYAGIVVSNDFLDLCGEDGTAFVENRHLQKYKEMIDCMVTYLWNRDYPSDRKLDVVPEEPDWELTDTTEFAGNSHDLITRNTYVKREKD